MLPATPDIETFDTPAAEKKHTGSKRQLAEQYLRTAYEFQFNEITGKPQFRTINTAKEFKPINDYHLNSLVREMDSYGLPNISANMVKEILSSSFNQMVNPIKQYFKQLPPYSGNTDYIKQLTDTVETGDAQFYDLFKKWMVATVACATTDAIINHTCLVFTGDKQGQYKTTWLNNLVPDALRDYRYCGSITIDDKDTLTKLAECFIINIDDHIHKLNKKDENALKNLITAPYAKYRRPYDKYFQEYPRIASFVASINGNEFLADTSGSRRFIPFQIFSIDINKANKVDMDMVYSQALHLFKSGFQYWFDRGEVDQLNERNKIFNIISIEEQLVLEYMLPDPQPGQFPTSMQPAILLSWLESKCRPGTRLSLRKLGEALKKHGYEKKQISRDGKYINHYTFIKRDST